MCMSIMKTRQSVPGLQLVQSRICVHCGMPAEKFCAGCEVTPYCSMKCQSKDWSLRHRAVCHNLSQLGFDGEVAMSVVEPQRRVQNPVPLRRPHVITEPMELPTYRDNDTVTLVSDSARSERFLRLQSRTKQHNSSMTQRDKKDFNTNKGYNEQRSPRQSNPHSGKIQQRTIKQKRSDTLDDSKTQLVREPEPGQEVKPVTIEKPPMPKPARVNVGKEMGRVLASVKDVTPSKKVVSEKPQVNGSIENDKVIKPASVKDATPSIKIIPEKYLVELLSVGDTVLLSVDSIASECNATHGDYVCVTMHEKYELDYQRLCEDYVLDCDADNIEFKMKAGELCSYYNPEDGGWYRARCLNATTLALFDSSKLVTVVPTDKIRKLPPTYAQIPEFCCVLECKNVEIGANLKCSIIGKSGDGYKVSIVSVENGNTFGAGILSRWQPAVEYIPVEFVNSVMVEVSRPPVTNNMRVVLVDATSLECAFVRPASVLKQREYDSIVQKVLLQGRRASPLKEPPTKGQVVIAKFSDGLHYRALCKRTNVAQNKYLLEYIDYGNIDICRNLDDMFLCPPNLDISAVPTQVSMIKLAPEPGELTPSALKYVEMLKDRNEEMILTLPKDVSSAESGSEVSLKIVKNNENFNKKLIELCTPEWKKFQESGGDVVQMAPIMYSDLKYNDLPKSNAVLEVLDVSTLREGVISGCVKGDNNAVDVFEQLTKKMNEYCNSKLGKEPYLPQVEELCIAQCPPYAQWFRALLLEHIGGAGGQNVRVCYIDYGNVEVVPVHLLRKILPEFVRDIPAVATHLDIEDFPSDPSPGMLTRAMMHMNLNEEGRGELTVRRTHKQYDGLYTIEVPELIKAMLNH